MSEKVHIFTPLLLTFLALSMTMQGNTACGQEGVQKMLTVEQMREDFTYMMEQYERIHPNPTWSLGEERYSKLKQQTLERLDHPMSTSDFWKIIARWNQHFDVHTWLSRLAVPIPQQGEMAFPPNSVVQYNNGRLWFGSYEAMPDIPFDIGYRFRFRSFTMEELQQMAGMVE